jgi:hypothetical protein
MGVILVS